MSQDELAEKIGVSRQSISLWETEQTQPTIDNIIALAKLFNISSDMLLADAGSTDASAAEPQPPSPQKKKSRLLLPIILSAAALLLLIGGLIWFLNSDGATADKPLSDGAPAVTSATATSKKPTAASTQKADRTAGKKPVKATAAATRADSVSKTAAAVKATTAAPKPQFDLFAYCKDFAIKKGTLNGDYCIYQQDAVKYGGYSNEYFSVSYWSDSNMVEFCLHCPLSDTQSENFYLRMRGGYNKKYEYLTSKYWRDTGESIRSATGYIDPAVFYDGYPIPCDSYQGSADGQTEFMEESRVGMCDLIRCLKQFVTAEKMECQFSDFDFVNF